MSRIHRGALENAGFSVIPQGIFSNHMNHGHIPDTKPAVLTSPIRPALISSRADGLEFRLEALWG